ncbi:MAG: hypothetical protein Kow0079_18100 [Vicingaceae bacterium]
MLSNKSTFFPFGMLSKSYESGYRFGFQGQERDDEIKGLGNSINFGARIYDSRLGKFLSTDPWESKYPWQTPFAYHRNSPTWKIDFQGYGDPVENPKIAPTNVGVKGGFFGFTRTYNSGAPKFHGGVDILATRGTQLKSIKSGTVYKVVNRLEPGEKGKPGQETGNYVIIKSTLEDGSTIFIKYAHLDKINVKEGQEIKEGEVFGEAGTTGNASGLPENRQHVHIEASTTPKFYPGKGKGGSESDTRVDPLQFFDSTFDEKGDSKLPKTKEETNFPPIDISLEGTSSSNNAYEAENF